jgi:hypothetical protein
MHHQHNTTDNRSKRKPIERRVYRFEQFLLGLHSNCEVTFIEETVGLILEAEFVIASDQINPPRVPVENMSERTYS